MKTVFEHISDGLRRLQLLEIVLDTVFVAYAVLFLVHFSHFIVYVTLTVM